LLITIIYVVNYIRSELYTDPVWNFNCLNIAWT